MVKTKMKKWQPPHSGPDSNLTTANHIPTHGIYPLKALTCHEQVCWWPRWMMLPGAQQSTKMLCLPGSCTGSCPPCFCSQESEVSRVWAIGSATSAWWHSSRWGPLGRAPRSSTIFVLLFSQKTIGWNLCLCWVKRVGWEIGVKMN